ncbi:MAG: LacI family DNA-binding transcriptional regulator [Microbacteriaceae bacterium]|nr:LacI family DNA-binding transcriptional regulator [Microbacteriaceae bacterium]
MEPSKVRAPNIRDVAHLAGVSHQTVSRVLNGSESIRPATRARVVAVIQQLGYRPNQAARALVTSKSRTIGVLSSHTAHYGPTTSLHAIEEAARLADYFVTAVNLVETDLDSVTAGLQHLMARAIEGLVVIAPQARVLEAFAGLALTIPVVTLDSTAQLSGSASADSFAASHSLSVDQIAGARMATRHLIELGHRDIRHVAGPAGWTEAAAREQGFVDEMLAAGLPVRAAIVGDWTSERGYAIGQELLRDRDFTALFVANDQMALGISHAFLNVGLSLPRDVSIVGFDDIPEASYFWPALTTVRQDFAELGRRSIALLLDELQGKSDLDHERILPELMVRASTAAPA